ncbi:MAG: hypothetical protein Q8942_15420 [Bacillota bacterium]|nr:hypothetical protein [Bacillota bacterium]
MENDIEDYNQNNYLSLGNLKTDLNQTVIPSPELVAKTNRFYKIPVFLSHPTSNTLNNLQISFLIRLMEELKKELLFPRTLPNTEQYPESTMTSIRRMVNSSFGIVTLNLARRKVKVVETNGATVFQNDIGNEFWQGSFFSFIEPAMAYQRGLPELFITESTVANQDINEQGGIFPFRVLIWDSSLGIESFFISVEWKEMLQNWSAEVRSAYYLNTRPDFESVMENA